MTAEEGLALIVADLGHARLHAGLSLAATAAAAGRTVRIFCHAEGVALMQPGRVWQEDAAYQSAGLPTIADLLETALDLGVAVMVCQSGLALMNLSAADLPVQIEGGGLLGFLERARGSRLVLV